MGVFTTKGDLVFTRDQKILDSKKTQSNIVLDCNSPFYFCYWMFGCQFNSAQSFNQDLTKWCVANIAEEPVIFSGGSALTEANKPIWGTCPDQVTLLFLLLIQVFLYLLDRLNLHVLYLNG